MAIKNIEEEYIPSTSKTQIPLTLTLSGAADLTVNTYYTLINNVVSLYIPPINGTATASTILLGYLPQEISPDFVLLFIGSVIQMGNLETQGLIGIQQDGALSIYQNIQGGNFTIGNPCGTYNGITLTYNLQ